MVIPLGNYYRCRSGVCSQVVTRSMARKMAAEMQTPELARSVETFVEVTPVLDLPDPLLDPSPLSEVSLDDTTTVADVEGDFGGKGKVCPETIQRCRFQAVDFEYICIDSMQAY